MVDKAAVIKALRGLSPISSANAMVIGENAAGPAEKRDLARAKKGVKGTGWFKDPVADLWGKEISDEGYGKKNVYSPISEEARPWMDTMLALPNSKIFPGTLATPEELVEHDEYFQRVPDIAKNTEVRVLPNAGTDEGTLGAYWPQGAQFGQWSGDSLTLAAGDVYGAAKPEDVFLHEMQHQADFRAGYDDNKRKDSLAPMAADERKRYLLNPTEIRARTTAQRQKFTDTERARLPYRANQAIEANRVARPDSELTYGANPSSAVAERNALLRALRDYSAKEEGSPMSFDSAQLMKAKMTGEPAALTGVGGSPERPGVQRKWRSKGVTQPASVAPQPAARGFVDAYYDENYEGWGAGNTLLPGYSGSKK
jgi:hypothetical protein